MAVEIIGKPKNVRRYREYLHSQGVLTKRFMQALKDSGHPVVKKPEGFRTFNGSIGDVYNVKTVNGVDRIEKKLSPDEKLYIRGIANANIIDRMDERLEPAGVDIENFMKNRVLLLDHLYVASATVGRVISLSPESEGVKFEAFVGDPSRAELTQPQKDARSLIAQRLLQTVSVGFIPHKVRAPEFGDDGRLIEPAVILEWELLELSVVAVPANAGSVFEIGNLSHSLNEKKTTVNRGLTSKANDETIEVSKQEDDSTLIQTLIFSKEDYTEEEAKEWAKAHDFRADKVDETEDSYRLRQKDPEDFEEGSFRTIDLTDGVRAVIGKLKTPGEDERAMEEKLVELLEEMKRIGTLLGTVSESMKTIVDQNEGIIGRLDGEDLGEDEPGDGEEEENEEAGMDEEDEDEKEMDDEEEDEEEDDKKSLAIAELKEIVEKQNEKIEQLSGIMLHLMEQSNGGQSDG